LKAILYEVIVSESAIDSVHGFTYKINEIHIPKLNISINHKFIFKTNKGRYKNNKKIGEIDINQITANIFLIFLQNQKVAMENGNILLSKYFPESKKKNTSLIVRQDVRGKNFTKKVK